MAISRSVEAAAHHRWVEPLARAGYATRGIVYLIIGGFAVFAAFGSSDVEGTDGAFATILSQPFGGILLWLVVLGLFGFALWRFIQAYIDTDGHGSSAKGMAIRTGLAGSGLAHIGLAMAAAGMVLGWGSGNGGGEDPTGRWIAAIYQAGFGESLNWSVTAIVVVVAGAQIWKAYKAGFEPYFRRCPQDVMKWVRPLGRIGLTARGVTFLVIASLIFYGACAMPASTGARPRVSTMRSRPCRASASAGSSCCSSPSASSLSDCIRLPRPDIVGWWSPKTVSGRRCRPATRSEGYRHAARQAQATSRGRRVRRRIRSGHSPGGGSPAHPRLAHRR